MLKASSPVFVYFFAVCFGLEVFRWTRLTNMVAIFTGIAIASAGELNFVLAGFLIQVCAITVEALRLSLVEILLNSRGLGLNALTTLYYVAPCCLAFLTIPWALLELPWLMDPDVKFKLDAIVFLSNCGVAFGLNLATFLLIGKTSALTLNVAGVVKDWLLIGLSYVLFGSPVSGQSLGGYGFAFFGVVYYNYSKQVEKAQSSSRQLPTKLNTPDEDESLRCRLLGRWQVVLMMTTAVLFGLTLLVKESILLQQIDHSAKTAWLPRAWEPQQTEPRLVTVLYGTNENPQFCALLKTSLLLKQEVHIVGWGPRALIPTVFADFARSLPPETLVIGADAFDTLWTSSATPERIVKEYTERWGRKFVWSAEPNMFPPFSEMAPWLMREYARLGQQDRETRYKYQNYGGWMGTAEDVEVVHRRVADQFINCTMCKCDATGEERHPFADSDEPGKQCLAPHDQGAAHYVYAAQEPPQGLDVDNVLFHPGWLNCEQMRANGDGTATVLDTGKDTMMVHFNGDGKVWCSASWYTKGWFTPRHVNTDEAKGAYLYVTGMWGEAGRESEVKKKKVPATAVCPYMWDDEYTWPGHSGSKTP